MTCTHQLPCNVYNPIHDILNFRLSKFPKHLRKPMKLLFKQYIILDIEMFDDSNYCNTYRHGRLIVRDDKYANIRYSDNNGNIFNWRIEESELLNN